MSYLDNINESLEETNPENQNQIDFGEKVDLFQKVVITAGSKALNLLETNNLTKDLEIDKRQKTANILTELSNFHYNIGFAGPQSSGKSSLINSLIGYPLMPTCVLASTGTPVELIYGEEIHVVVKDEDQKDEDQNSKIVFEKRCQDISDEDFRKLKEYACKIMSLSVIENMQYFCDLNILINEKITMDNLQMDKSDPKQVALLFLILFTVFVQEKESYNEIEQDVFKFRLELLRYFGIPENTINFGVVILWNSPLLKTGLMLTDLPGLGSYAPDQNVNGKILKGLDTITKEAILRTDTMAFMSDPNVTGDAVPLLETMISNANIRNAISIEERIVPIMNKIDLVYGTQKTKSINKMVNLMENVGVSTNNRKVWEISSLCGEFAFEGLDVSRSFYVARKKCELLDQGYNDSEIEEELDKIIKGMERLYKSSGIIELRNFLQSAFVNSGKYHRTISTVNALKSLAVNMISPLQSIIDINSMQIIANDDFINEALEYLKSAAITPLNNAQESDEEKQEKINDTRIIIQALVEDATSQYEVTFSNAVEKYQKDLKKITEQFQVQKFTNKARIDNGHSANHRVYQQLIDKSKKITVDLKEVNKRYAVALNQCKKIIDSIYEKAQSQLRDFQMNYPEILKNSIDQYRNEASPEVIEIMDNLLPILQKYVVAKIDSAEFAIDDQHKQFQKVAEQLAADIISNNDRYINILHEMVDGKLVPNKGNRFTHYLYQNREFILVEGSNGLKATIDALSLTKEDRNVLQQDIKTTGNNYIVNPLNSWYENAEIEAKKILVSLVNEILNQFQQISETLINKNQNLQNKANQDKQTMEALRNVFEPMCNEIKPQLDDMLKLQDAEDSQLSIDLLNELLRETEDING